MRELRSRDVLLELLESWHDAREALRRSRDLSYTGQMDSVALEMSKLWHEGSYPHLETALLEMRVLEPTVYWHVAERFIRCGSKTIESGCPFCRQPSTRVHIHPNPVTKRSEKWHPERISVKVVNRAVSPERIEEGLTWLDCWFTEQCLTPFLPREIWEAVAA